MSVILTDLLSGDDTRAEAVLPEIQKGDLPALLAALQTGDTEACWWVIRALLGLVPLPPEIAPALVARAADPDPDLRAMVFHALGTLQAPSGILPLLFALNDPSPYLARVAAEALIQIGPPAVPGLLRALENDVEPQVRTHAARALALMGDPAAIPALFHALEDESSLVQYWAEVGLERLGVGEVYFSV